MNKQKLELFKNTLGLNVKDTVALLGITRRFWDMIQKGERNISHELARKVENILAMKNKMLANAESVIKQHGDVKKIALLIYSNPADIDGGLLGMALNNAVGADLFCKYPQIKVVQFHKENYMNWLDEKGLSDISQHRSLWATLQ